MKKHSKWVIILALLVLIILLPPGGATVSFPVPNPNGYDDFLRAAAAARRTLDEPEMRRIYNAGVYAASKEDLQNWILQGADAITLFHTGMARQCRVPVQTTPQYLAAHSQDAGSLKFLTHFLVA